MIRKTAEIEYHLPTGFEGPVIVMFEQSDGENPTKKNGRTIISVPRNGLVKLEWSNQTGQKTLL